jgi:F5/8 type C domain/NedA-like, galactose-binding domain
MVAVVSSGIIAPRVFISPAVLAFFIFAAGFSAQSDCTAGVPAVNVALAANGGVATASSTYNNSFPVAAVIDGDRKGLNWENGGGWNDATANAYPDWVQIDFSATQAINEIDLFTIQDNYNSPAMPTLSMHFSRYGVTDFEVQYWTGSAWADVPGGNVTGNRNVWRQFAFANITTSKIRVLVNSSLANYSRIVEIEAYRAAPVNVALAANGSMATASSTYNNSFPVAAVNDGDHKGLNWGNGGGWNDATATAYPDWVQIDFSASQTINEIDLFTIQDNYNSPAAPTLGMQFSRYGVTDFEVQYWTGSAWVDVPGGNVTGNRNVWRQFGFANITTSKIRVLVNNSLGNYSRIVEIEAYQVGDSPAPTSTPTPVAAATPTPVPVPLSSPTQQVWIAVRSDGLPGSGTQSDPYDGSTQPKFDALMSQFPTNTAIHLGAGTFQTHGGMSWQPKDGWQILGAGIDITTIVQTAIQDSQFQVIGGLANNAVVSDLTVDCNYINLAPTLYGTNEGIGAIAVASGYINNIRVIHAGGQHETFTLGFCQYGVNSIPPTSVLIENCRVEENGPHVTAIWAHDSQGTINSDTVPRGGQATIRNCTVMGNGDRTLGGIGFQINGYKSGIIDHCTASGSVYAIYRDTLPQTNLWITNSNVTGVVNAIGLCGSTTDGVTISGNTLAAGDIIVRTNAATNVTISNNVLLPGPNYNSWWTPLQTTSLTYIDNNQFSPAILNGSAAVPLGNKFGNRYFDGTIVPFLLDNYAP